MTSLLLVKAGEWQYIDDYWNEEPAGLWKNRYAKVLVILKPTKINEKLMKKNMKKGND